MIQLKKEHEIVLFQIQNKNFKCKIHEKTMKI